MKPRTQSEKLTGAEIAKIRSAFYAGIHPLDAADEVNCTKRIVNKYYQMFRGHPLKPGERTHTVRRKRKPAPARPRVESSRFYTSTFEL